MSIRSRHPYRAGGRVTIVAAVAAGLLLAGCAQPSTERGSAAGGTASTAAPAPTMAPGSPPTTGSDKAPISGQIVVRGTLRNGVEPGCLLLDGQDKHAYLLLDAAGGQLKAGARVEVVGQPVDQVASICGEGSTLSVVSVQPLR
jgi:hypothetical protein